MELEITKREKRTFLKNNGWCAHWNDDCWYVRRPQELFVNENGVMDGYRPKEEGFTLDKAYKIVKELVG